MNHSYDITPARRVGGRTRIAFYRALLAACTALALTLSLLGVTDIPAHAGSGEHVITWDQHTGAGADRQPADHVCTAWEMVLTSGGARIGSASLTVDFEDAPTRTVAGAQTGRGRSAWIFRFTEPVPDRLEQATATVAFERGGGGTAVLTLGDATCEPAAGQPDPAVDELLLRPRSGTPVVGQTHTLTAEVSGQGAPSDSAQVRFEIWRSSEQVMDATETAVQGAAEFAYSYEEPVQDRIVACTTPDGTAAMACSEDGQDLLPGVVGDTTTVDWQADNSVPDGPPLQFRTTWVSGDQTVTKTHTAVLGDVNDLDLDGEGSEVRAKVAADDNGAFTLTVERLGDTSDRFRYSLEAILTAPEGETIAGRRHLTFGFDGRDEGASDFVLLELSQAELEWAVPQYRLDVRQSTDRPAGPISLSAGRFDGTVAEPVEEEEVRIAYGTLSWQTLAIVSLPADLELDTLLRSSEGGDVTVAGRTSRGGQTRHVDLAVHQGPQGLRAEVLAGGNRLKVDADDTVGQLRLAVHDGTGQLPARSLLGDTIQRDRLDVHAEDEELTARFTAFKNLDVSVVPFHVALVQDSTATRPLEITAALQEASVDALLDRPGSSTSISMAMQTDQPLRMTFNNSHNLSAFHLSTAGLGGVEDADFRLENVSRRLSICMDQGPECRRGNPHLLQRYPTRASLDFDDHGTHGTGSGPTFRTTLNATVAFDPADPIRITDLRFRNVGLDLGEELPAHSSNCGFMPRLQVFFDSRGHPFVMDELRFGPIVDYRLGTDTNPARATARLSRINGWSTGFFGCLGGANQSHAGGLGCGGRAELYVRSADPDVDVVDLSNLPGGTALNVCGGTVSNPQPW